MDAFREACALLPASLGQALSRGRFDRAEEIRLRIGQPPTALIGGAVKLVLNAAFIIIPSINISGAALSMLITNIVCLIYEVYVMRRKFGIKTSVARAAWKPVIAALLSGAALYYFYNGLSAVLPLAAVIIISGILGCISYLLILLLIDSEDFTAVLGILKRSKCTSRENFSKSLVKFCIM